ncbi:MAG: hypothetical protein WC346_09285 [Methanogenium sp.]|jgi:hypothetical protein
MNSYLSRVISEMVLSLRDNKHGVPMQFFKDEELMSTDDAHMEAASNRMDEAYTKISEGFRLYAEDMCGYGYDGDTQEEKDNRVKFNEAKELFNKYFETFWD